MHLKLLLFITGWQAGTLTTIKAKYKGANIFTFVSPELQGGWCSSSAGCPEGVLLHGWSGSRCHVVVSVFMAAVSAGHTLCSLG